MSNPSNLRALLIAAPRMAIAPEPARASSDALDGRNFDGIVLECGKTSGDADTLTLQGRPLSVERMRPVRLRRRSLYSTLLR